MLGATQDSVQTGQKGHTPLPPGGVVYPDIYRYVRFDPPTCYRHPPIYIFVLTSLKFWGLGLGRWWFAVSVGVPWFWFVSYVTIVTCCLALTLKSSEGTYERK